MQGRGYTHDIVDGTRLPKNITMEWKRMAVPPNGTESELILKNSTHRNTHEAVSTLTTTESDSVSNINYTCTAGEPKISNISYIDISVIEGIIKLKRNEGGKGTRTCLHQHPFFFCLNIIKM